MLMELVIYVKRGFRAKKTAKSMLMCLSCAKTQPNFRMSPCSGLDRRRSVENHRLSVHCSIEEIRVYREHFEGCRLQFTGEQRRRFGVKAKALGRKALEKSAGIVTPGNFCAGSGTLSPRNTMCLQSEGPRRAAPAAKDARPYCPNGE